MRAPRIFRTTPFRLTLLFLALFAAAASAFLAYIYLATAGEVNRRADATISRELASLEAVYRRGGFAALNQAIIERSTGNQVLLYLLMDRSGAPISGSIARSPIKQDLSGRTWGTFVLADTDADGAIVRRPARGAAEAMSGGERLFVGADVGDSEAYVVGIVRALWGAGALVLVLGLAGGILVSRNVSRNISSLTDVIESARAGDLHASAPRSETYAVFARQVALPGGGRDRVFRPLRSVVADGDVRRGSGCRRSASYEYPTSIRRMGRPSGVLWLCRSAN